MTIQLIVENIQSATQDKTVKAMDILFPGIGEIVGGSQREERLDVLNKKMNDLGVNAEESLVVFRLKKIWNGCAFWIWTWV